MLIGPVFTREAVTAPRRPRFYIVRTVYVISLFVLVCTAWAITAGAQHIRNVSDMSRFGGMLFQILAPLQLAVVVFLAAIVAAGVVAQEKDRRTLVLLLMTRMSNHELVLGKLFAGLLGILVMIAAALPLFFAITLFGGISYAQVCRVFAVTTFSAIAAGSLGVMIAFSREKTFQTLALTVLLLLIWIGLWEAVHSGVLFQQLAGYSSSSWAQAFSPLRAILAAAQPTAEVGGISDYYRGISPFLLSSFGMAVLINGWTSARVRKWNPSNEVRRLADVEGTPSIWGADYEVAGGNEQGAAADQTTAEPAAVKHAAAEQKRAGHVDARVRSASSASRPVWDNPVLWREICTWAYGRKVIVIRLVYLLLFVMTVLAVHQMSARGLFQQNAELQDIPAVARLLAPFFLVSLVIVNALAVTSITNERDGQALDLLLVTDLTPKEFVFGKLLGVFWVAKEMLILPLLLVGYLWWIEGIQTETMLLLIVGLVVLDFFVSMLGVHCGMHYANSRSAAGVSLGIVFFLFLGVVSCIAMMVSFAGSFQTQLLPFAVFIGGGAVGLYVSLGVRNPSPAILAAALLLPYCTFNAITSFLLKHPFSVFVWCGVYGYATVAMLIPAIGAFDIAMGRTKAAGDE